MVSPLAQHLKPISREVVERIAKIIGGDCAARRSLNDLDERISRGEPAEIFTCGDMFVIGPRPEGLTE